MNNEKIKEIEDFSKGMWLNYGCKVAKEIPNRQFLMIKTSHANSILNGLSLSGIQFSAKYDERNLMLYYSLNDKIKVKEILNKAKTDTANFIEQLLSDYDWGSKESYASLLPEIADIMSISTSTLENHPPLVQLRLEMAYAQFHIFLEWTKDITNNICSEIDEKKEHYPQLTEQEVMTWINNNKIIIIEADKNGKSTHRGFARRS